MPRKSPRCCLIGLILCTLWGCQKPDEAASRPTPAEAPAAGAVAPDTPTSPSEAGVIRLDGFGPARFGDAEESVRIAWGAELEAGGAEPDTCKQLFARSGAVDASDKDVSFMLVDGRFARYDIVTPRYTAPGGIAVGDPVSRVTEAHAGHVEIQPHKYVEGAKTLVVTPENGQAARLVFETSPDGTITRWRIGMPPAVFFVEGCA